MKQGRRRGFTIIEVILFLAISGLLLLVAFAFTASSIRNTRFSDATKSLENFVKDQYTRVQTNSLALNTPDGRRPVCSPSSAVAGENASSGTGTSNCILMGSILEFNPIAGDRRTVNIYPILGYAPNSSSNISQANLRVWTESTEQYQLPWQAEFVTARVFRMSTTPPSMLDGINSIVILRDTTSERINFHLIRDNLRARSLSSLDFESASSGTRNLPTLICIRSDDGGSLRGAVRINGSGKEYGMGIGSITSSVVPTSEVFFGSLPGGLRCT